jgi:putative methyltransferase (TIGR04325 family)
VVAALLAGGVRERLYPSFAEAARHGAYDAELLTRFRVDRAKLNVESISGRRMPPGYLMLFAAVHRAPAPARVVDFGGACGEWGFALRRDANRELDYTVVENEALVARCTADPFFAWARFLSRLPERMDVFLSSGALQYVDDPYRVLEHAFATATTAVVLSRNSFSERELFRVHRSRLGDNGFGAVLPAGFDPDVEVRYPHRTISLRRVHELARGWRCAFEIEEASGVLPYRSEVFGRDLLFLREGDGRPS